MLTYCEIGLPSTSLGPDLCLLNIYTEICLFELRFLLKDVDQYFILTGGIIFLMDSDQMQKSQF